MYVIVRIQTNVIIQLNLFLAFWRRLSSSTACIYGFLFTPKEKRVCLIESKVYLLIQSSSSLLGGNIDNLRYFVPQLRTLYMLIVAASLSKQVQKVSKAGDPQMELVKFDFYLLITQNLYTPLITLQKKLFKGTLTVPSPIVISTVELLKNVLESLMYS